MKPVLLDTGPLVALLDRSDPHHQACVEELREVRAPLLTTWLVVTEAAHLLASVSLDAQDQLLAMLESGAVVIHAPGQGDLARMRALMRKYGDLPMDLADASLLVLGEKEGAETVLTTDRRDFSVYRFGSGRRFKVRPEPRRTT